MPDLATNPTARLARARATLDGLALGDAFGERFFARGAAALLASRALPPAPWAYTDDTEMALGLYDCLARHGAVDQDALARIFARRYHTDPWKGYGGTIRGVLRAIMDGIHWRTAAGMAYGGEGSLGNGAAMRVAVLGAYFADAPDLVAEEARRSAAVTHAHVDGQAGAISVAVAAAWAWRAEAFDAAAMFGAVLAATPRGATHDGIARARDLPAAYLIPTAARVLGNGSQVVSSDTVPLCLWLVARHPGSVSEALWAAVQAEGDRDTTSAIIGGIMAGLAGAAQPPAEWVARREELRFDVDLAPPPVDPLAPPPP